MTPTSKLRAGDKHIGQMSPVVQSWAMAKTPPQTPIEPVKEASVDEVAEWFNSLGFGDYTRLYVDSSKAKGINGRDLCDTEWDADLLDKELSVKLRVHQRKILRN